MGEKEAFVNKKWMKEQNEAVDTYRKLEKQLKALIKAEKDEFDEGEELRERLAKLWFHLPGEERRRINNGKVTTIINNPEIANVFIIMPKSKSSGT